MPAQQMTPLSGEEWAADHWTVAVTAAERESEEETSVWVKRVREESESRGDVDGGGGLRSRMETLALAERRVRAVDRPRPDEPPEMRNVLFDSCIVRFLYEDEIGKKRRVEEQVSS